MSELVEHLTESPTNNIQSVSSDQTHKVKATTATKPSILVRDDGWAVGPSSNILFWVPPSLLLGLLLPSHVYVICRTSKTRISLQNFTHRLSWAQCFTSLLPL